MQGGKAPTARQKRWHKWLGEQPCVGCGDIGVSLHHCVGSTGKHNKVWIGQDFIIPLCYECHQGQGGVHGDMSRIISFMGFDPGDTKVERKSFEKSRFSYLVRRAIKADFDSAPPFDVSRSIMDYHK